MAAAVGRSTFQLWIERARLTPAGASVLGLVVGDWLVARSLGAKALYLLAYAGLLVVLLAWLSGRRAIQLSVDRSELPPRVRAGQQVAVALDVVARRRVSTVVVHEDLPAGLGTSVSVPVASLAKGETLRREYSFVPPVRGVYQIGPARASWSDPFGLTAHDQQLSEPDEVLVHPVTEPVRDRVLTRMWEDPPVRPPVSKPWPVGFEFYGMREYLPGDDPRNIIWSAYARTGTLMVRESEQGITDRVVLLLDSGRDAHAPGVPSPTFETAVSAVASAGVQHLHDGFAVTLLTCSGTVVSGLRGARSQLSLLDELARVERDDRSLLDAHTGLLDLAKQRPHVLVVTTTLPPQTATLLRLLHDRGLSIVVVHVMHDEGDPTTGAMAASIGAGVVQLPVGASLAAAFTGLVGARR